MLADDYLALKEGAYGSEEEEESEEERRPPKRRAGRAAAAKLARPARRQEQSILDELRAYLDEAAHERKKGVMTVTQADCITFLGNTIAQQQALISKLNSELFAQTTRVRAEEEALRQRERRLEERERRLAIEAVPPTAPRSQRPADEIVPPQQARVVPRDEIVPLPPKQVRIQVIAEPDAPSQADDEEEEDRDALYTWRVVSEKSPRCIELYGFTPQQVAAMFVSMNALAPETNGRGNRSQYGERYHLLLFLYHFTHYVTLRVMHHLFGMSPNGIQQVVSKMIGHAHRGLFERSRDPPRGALVRHYVHASYFFALQKPADSVLAARLYDAERDAHGVHVHCVHDARSEKAVAYYTSQARDVDAEWLAQYKPLMVMPLGYEARMRGKFAIARARFRGTIKELDAVVGCLLALTNTDLGYGNAVVAAPADVSED